MEQELAGFRRDMLKFARLHLRDEALAEDAVQEALVAALAGQKGFDQRSQLKTWVFAILKRKIIDLMRERARSSAGILIQDEIAESTFDDLFDDQGHWLESTQPGNWGNPEQLFASQQFWQVLEICLTRLPEKTARVFTMREVLELEPDEICKELALSATNYWVIMHRARMALRLCLETNWLDSERGHA